jgi:triacylglycerol esterase/lipase EstA (alpha/beta hydrolase family)
MKVSFFGHSMGGIIIRSALPKLEKYKDLFHSFVTLSTPHVGYCYSNSKLVDVGLWLISNWKKCQSILQLTMSDNKNGNNQRNNKSSLEDTFLYKLS